LARKDAAHWDWCTDTTRRNAAKRALDEAQKLAPNLPETRLALGYYQYWVLRDYGAAKITFGRVGKMLPSGSEAPRALGYVARREGKWDRSIAYLEQALVLDPRNVALLIDLAETYAEVRQLPAALKLFDQALDIKPSEPDVMATKASIYQAQGNLPEAARLLSGINEQTSNRFTFGRKLDQLHYERNYGEAIRMLRARLAQFRYESQELKDSDQLMLAFFQHFDGDTTGAQVTAKQARKTIEQFYRDHPDSSKAAADLADAYALMGEKDSA